MPLPLKLSAVQLGASRSASPCCPRPDDLPPYMICGDEHSICDCPIRSVLQLSLDARTLIPRGSIPEEVRILLGPRARRTHWSLLLEPVPWIQSDSFPILSTPTGAYIRMCAHLSQDALSLDVVVRNVTDVIYLLRSLKESGGMAVAINQFGQIEDVVGSAHGRSWLHRPIMARIDPEGLQAFLTTLSLGRQRLNQPPNTRSLLLHAASPPHVLAHVRWRILQPWEYPVDEGVGLLKEDAPSPGEIDLDLLAIVPRSTDTKDLILLFHSPIHADAPILGTEEGWLIYARRLTLLFFLQLLALIPIPIPSPKQSPLSPPHPTSRSRIRPRR